MCVTPADALAGLLPVVISGARPKLSHRTTSRLLGALHGVTAEPVWLVRDCFASDYEREGHEVCTYPQAEAEAYAQGHWMGHEPWQPGAFLGCFTEREWSCRLAEQRGCWGVLQLDDNLRVLLAFVNRAASRRLVASHGGLAMFADLLAAVALSTNARMVGAHLSSANPANEPKWFARPGFPYSLFIEKVGEGREPYYGPIEEDILHAYQYGRNASPDTAAVVVPLRYLKDHSHQDSGMRAEYARHHERSVALQRMAPEIARLSYQRTHSNGAGAARVFHKMIRGAIRTPLVVTDPDLFAAAQAFLAGLADEFAAEYAADVAAKVNRRAARAKP